MNFSEWAKTHTVSPEVLWAGEYLERHGYVFGENFSVGTAVDEASKILCGFLDETEEWESKINRIRVLGYSDWT